MGLRRLRLFRTAPGDPDAVPANRATFSDAQAALATVGSAQGFSIGSIVKSGGLYARTFIMWARVCSSRVDTVILDR